MPDNSRGNLFPEIDNQICAQSQFEKHIGMSWKQAIEVLSGKCFLKSEQTHQVKGNQSDVHGDVPDEGVSSEVPPGGVAGGGQWRCEARAALHLIVISESSESSASSHEKGFAALCVERSRKKANNADQSVMYRHRQRRTLHMGHAEWRAKLACGRPLTTAMAVFRGKS